MKPGQLSLRKLFIVVTVVAVYIAIVSGIMRYREYQTHQQLISEYLKTRKQLDSSTSANAEQVRKMLDDNWIKNSKEPIPEYPEPK